MPGIDGFELARRIRQDAELSATIIMMLSSGDRPDDGTQSDDELGIAVYLTKPIKQSELFDAIVTALDVRPAEPIQDARVRIAATPASARCLQILLAEDSPVNQTLGDGAVDESRSSD